MQSVDRDEVARYYVKSECGKKVSIWLSSENELKDFNHGIDSLHGENLGQKVQKLSLERKNEIYQRLYKEPPYTWSIDILPSSFLHLPEIKPEVNEELKKVDWKLDRVVDILRNQPNEVLKQEFYDDGKPVYYRALIVLKENNRFRIIDGSHRAVILRLRGITQFECYVGSLQSLRAY